MPAIAAVGVLDQVVVAIAALLVILAASIIFRPQITGALASLPVVGGWVASRVDQLMVQIAADALGQASQALAPAADLFRRLWALHSVLGGGILHTLQNTYNALWRLKYQVLPQQIADTQAFARQLAQQAEQYAQQLAEQVAAQDQVAVQAVARYAQQLAAQDQEYAQQLAQQVGAAGEAADQRIAQYAQQLVYGAEVAAEAGDQATQRFAQQLAQAGISYTAQAIQELEGLIEQVGAQSNGYAQQLEGQAIQHADAVGAALATWASGAITSVEARVSELEDSPCQQQCDPLGQLGSLISGLDDAGTLGILLALIAQAVHDPHGLAQELDQAVGQPARALAGLLAGIGR